MKEIDVFNLARAYLRDPSFTVAQLVPPGGQAPYSVSFSVDDRKRTIFPDLLAVRGGVIWVGELKPDYDLQDHQKLEQIHKHGEAEVFDLCGRATRGKIDLHSVNYVLCHSNSSVEARQFVYQWIFLEGSNGPLVLQPATA